MAPRLLVVRAVAYASRDLVDAEPVRDAAAQALGVAAHDLDGELVVGRAARTAVAVRTDELRLLDEEHDRVELHGLREGAEHADAASDGDECQRVRQRVGVAADRLDDDVGSADRGVHFARCWPDRRRRRRRHQARQPSPSGAGGARSQRCTSHPSPSRRRSPCSPIVPAPSTATRSPKRKSTRRRPWTATASGSHRAPSSKSTSGGRAYSAYGWTETYSRRQPATLIPFALREGQRW